MIKNLNRREQFILFVTVIIIVMGIFFNFILLPLLNKEENLNKEIALTKAKFKKYIWLLNQKENIKNKFSKFSANINSPTGDNGKQAEVLTKLESLAKDAAINIVDIRPQNSALKERGVDLEAEGDITSFLKFIYSIENSASLLNIKKLQLRVKPGGQALKGVFSIIQLSAKE